MEGYIILFSIIITSYNMPEYLDKAIQSVYNQDYNKDFELIVINDSDKPGQPLEYSFPTNNSYVKPFYVFTKRNLGIQKAYNLGAYYATQSWILRVDGDEELLPNALSDLADFINKNIDPKLALIYSDLIHADVERGTEKTTIQQNWDGTLTGLNRIGHLQIIKRSISEEIGHWRLISYGADTAFIVELVSRGYHVKHIPKTLYYSRLYPEQFTQRFLREGNNPQQIKKELIFDPAIKTHPDLWPENIQNIIFNSVGDQHWREEVLVIQKYCIGNGIDLKCGSQKINPFAIGIDMDRKDGKNPELVWDIKEDLPFKNETLDYICAPHLLEYLDNPETAICNWWSILKHGGYLILVVPDKKYMPENSPGHKHNWNLGEFQHDIVDKLSLILSFELVVFKELNNKWSFIAVLRKK